MKRFFIALAVLGLFSFSEVKAENDHPVKPNYELAERFSQKKISKMVHSTMVNPQWFEHSDRFWYSYKTSSGTRFYIVDPAKKSKKEMFDLDELASELTLITRDPMDALHIPMQNMQLRDDRYFTFEIQSKMKIAKKDDEGEEIKGETEFKRFYFSYDLEEGKLSEVEEDDLEKDFPYWANVSPDGKTAMFAKGFDLYYMDMENLQKAIKDDKDSTIVEHRLTEDGTMEFSYTWGTYTYDRDELEEAMEERIPAYGLWSADSKHFAVTRTDFSMVKDLWVIDVLSQPRPKLEAYKYQMPGEENSVDHLYIFNMETKEGKEISTSKYAQQEIRQIGQETPVNLPGNDQRAIWMGDENGFYINRISRDLKRNDLCYVDIQADTCREIIHEELNTYVETRTPHLMNGSIVEWSERDGWAHLYLHGADGQLQNAITKGAYHVADIIRTDDKTGTVYFTANGKEKGINPYYTYLYKVSSKGGEPVLLNEGNYDNRIYMSQDARYFVNNYSRVDCAPKSALYDNNGRKIMDLEEADFSQLLLAGYRFPEIFTVKAGDGITDLYGVMYKPYDFDSTKTYPLIEYVYPGPQTEANNSFWSAGVNRTDRLAQMGFIVVTVGNRGGHPDRSKWYHNYGYGNLRDYGLEDKKVAAQQLAARYDFIDINRVGIHGHSGGGFMSTAAILTYPDFFKVAVSCAGNHDNRIYNRWWSEQHHGIDEVVSAEGDTTFVYSIETNQELAGNLKGHLLLVTGNIDNNVHPGNTLRVVNALIRANKRFDMLVLPGQRHGFGDMDEYFFWKMADYFSLHFLGECQTSVDIPQMNND